mgnify:CR=1 FL=1
MKLSSPEVTSKMANIAGNMKKSRLCLLMLEFYAYMEQQGFPEYWKNCKGILYPQRKLYNKLDRNLYWHFKWKDGTETELLADEHNMHFKELRGFTLNKEAK